MSIHKVSIRSILFRNGASAKASRKAKRKINKANALPGLKELKRSRSQKNKVESRKSLSRLFVQSS